MQSDRNSTTEKSVTLFIRAESKLLFEHVEGEVIIGHRKRPCIQCLPAYTCTCAPRCFLP
jgi:hypothetical protein